ncbi:Polycystin cation channel-domain-containing protein [Baffinella frigidus]|nr:Polycystin cation channel-domain-containing protein [Cryptophyta sp. CCMP2293]
MINADSLSFLWEVYVIFNAVNLLISLFRMLSCVYFIFNAVNLLISLFRMLSCVYFIFNAVNLLISLFRMLSYVRINPNISQLTDTFAHCKDQIAQFAVVLALLLVTFTIMANLMFGAKVFEFSTFGEGFLSTVQIMIGNGDYFLIDKADKIAAPLFYYPFIMIMIFVVFNMTIGAPPSRSSTR